jgi:hypothetical protein
LLCLDSVAPDGRTRAILERCYNFLRDLTGDVFSCLNVPLYWRSRHRRPGSRIFAATRRAADSDPSLPSARHHRGG